MIACEIAAVDRYSDMIEPYKAPTKEKKRNFRIMILRRLAPDHILEGVL